jgi:SNF2 family DNA or RNA helicase
VITTYALAHRDRETLGKVQWGRIVLDEAQYIKNPASKQSQAVRALQSHRRVALTGTPVENRLSELWSIMDFLNPGYLGGSSGFRTRFALPIERYKDKQKGEQLRGLVRPFVLRRLKSDPTVVADLPAKLESREFGYLTAEQASLYEACVKRMLTEVDTAEGMQRRGLVLSALVRLKQICNHPSQVLKDWDNVGSRLPDPSRSGKCVRLLEMLDEVIGEGDQSLIFTQFRQMGHILETMIKRRFDRDVLFIHGGTTQPQRTSMVERFQRADGTVPVLLLSLRAGGVGLNLTAATHVFHFDRWWNPAVENQATDRAYRIGQTRTVQVHKFVVRGTLEERIDQMIESKSELAENIIGAGEAWLSELSTDQLRDILTLRNDAIDDVEV